MTGTDYAASAAHRAVEALSQPYEIEGVPVRITASAGVGVYPEHGEDADALIESADRALFAAKHAGKNAFRISGEPGSYRR